MLGEEDEALKSNYFVPFTDVDEWAEKYISYAYAKDITMGTSATTFSGKDLVDRKQALTIMLRSLGYSSSKDFEWNKSDEFAKKINLYQNTQTSTFKRSELNSMVKKTLEFNLKDDEIKLLEKLIRMGVIKQSDINTTRFNVNKGDVKYISLSYDKAVYRKGEKVDLKDLVVNVNYTDGSSKEAVEYTTNIDKVDLTTDGIKDITVTYENGTNGNFTAKLCICITDDELYQENGLVYSVVEDTTSAKVIDCVSTANEITIPSSIKYNGKTYNVNFIKDNAFAKSKSANGYTSYTSSNYYSTGTNRSSGLIAVHGGKNVKYVGEYAFAGCRNLSTIEFMSDLECINKNAFSNTDIKELTLNKVENLRDSAFSGCVNLEEVELPKEIAEFGSKIFYGCTSLKKIKFPQNITCLNNAVEGCTNLVTVNIPKSVTHISENEFKNCEKIDSLNIPDGVKEIDSYAFSGCSGLNEISLPKDLEQIGYYAFDGCYSLSSLVIPKNTKEIDNIFGNSCSLKSLVFEEGCSTDLRDFNISNDDNIKEITFPSGIRFLGHSYYVIDKCNNLKTVNAMNITDKFIRNCSKLTTVNIGNVSEIPEKFIVNCDSLKTITIPKTVYRIVKEAFKENDLLSKVIMSDELSSYQTDVYFGENGHIINYVSLEKIEAEEEAKKKAEEEAKLKKEQEEKEKAEEEARLKREQEENDEDEMNYEENEEDDDEETKIEFDPQKEEEGRFILMAQENNSRTKSMINQAYNMLSKGVNYAGEASQNAQIQVNLKYSCPLLLDKASESIDEGCKLLYNCNFIRWTDNEFDGYDRAVDTLNEITDWAYQMNIISSDFAVDKEDYEQIFQELRKLLAKIEINLPMITY